MDYVDEAMAAEGHLSIPGEAPREAPATDNVGASSTGVVAVAGETWVAPVPTIIKKTPLYNLISLNDERFIDLNGAHISRDYREMLNNCIRRSLGVSVARRFDNLFPITWLAAQRQVIEPWIDRLDHIDGMTELVEMLDAERAVVQARVAERLASGEVEFADLEHLFTIGERVTEIGEDPQAGYVEEVETHRGFMGSYAAIKIRVVSTIGGEIGYGYTHLIIGDFDGLRKITDLPVRVCTPEDLETLNARGKKFVEFSTNGSYLHCSGNVTVPAWRSERHYRANGRVMIDMVAMLRINPDRARDIRNGMRIESDDDDRRRAKSKKAPAVVPEQDYFCCVPLLHGFSFVAKEWGNFRVDDLAPIKFSDRAFSQLVMPEDDKALIRGLVAHHGGSFEDLIDGKGGGCIFLLHGAPGEGKTLTAEAVAELLHRPLYTISVGELGTDPGTLETSLREILDVATSWNAVILLDEADIFLEERNEQDIVRNAMVGVFLRLLEYHQGVMFLTTNRVKNIDSAFYSRISVALAFPKGGPVKRASIWRNLLDAAGVEGIDARAMGALDLNGRQIKNAIRNAQTLARAEEAPLTADHIMRCVKVTQKFHTDIKPI